MTYAQIRHEQYHYHKDFSRSWYSWFKLCIYMEGATPLVYLLQYTNIHPNIVSLLYAIICILGAYLMILGGYYTLIAVFIFFFKTILDATDGHLARIKNKESAFGKRLDVLCGRITVYSFYVGLSGFVIKWVLPTL